MWRQLCGNHGGLAAGGHAYAHRVARPLGTAAAWRAGGLPPGSGALAYQCAVSTGYSVIPTPDTSAGKRKVGPDFYFRLLAHKAPITREPLAQRRRRHNRYASISPPSAAASPATWTTGRCCPGLHTRTLLHDDAGVLWQDRQRPHQRALQLHRPALAATRRHPLSRSDDRPTRRDRGRGPADGGVACV